MGNSEADLTRKAKKLCAIEPRVYGHELLGYLFCDPVWLTQHLLLAHTRLGDGFFADPYQLDTRTGRVTFLPKVGKQINTLRGATWQFSSDQQWFLYRYGILHNFAMVAVARDGSLVQRWKLQEPLEFCEYFWLPGTHQWMELWGGADSPDRPTVARLYRLGRATPLWERKLPRIEATGFIGYGPMGEALLADLDSGAGKLHLAYLSLPTLDRIRQESIVVGKGELEDGQLTPDKKHLVFRRERSLWIVGLDGRGRRCLGSVPKEGAFSLAGWQPKTGALVFYYRGCLYRCPP